MQRTALNVRSLEKRSSACQWVKSNVTHKVTRIVLRLVTEQNEKLQCLLDIMPVIVVVVIAEG